MTGCPCSASLTACRKWGAVLKLRPSRPIFSELVRLMAGEPIGSVEELSPRLRSPKTYIVPRQRAEFRTSAITRRNL